MPNNKEVIKMSMYVEADKLKKRFKGFSEEQLNTVIRFGQVAKFRCRSNIAYRNFIEACFSEVADIVEETITTDSGESYTKIKAKIKR